jgi:hypothetical protein
MNRIVLVTFLLVAALSGCGKSTPPPAQEISPPPMAAADCCQCVSPGSPDTPSQPVACFPGTTNQTACDQACGNNTGGLMTGSCSDGIRCQ